MAGEVDAQRLAAKRFSQRNSDGRFGWGGEEGGTDQMQAPPGFEEQDHDLPPGTVRASNPDPAEEARAIRHVHVFDSQVPTEEP